MTDWTAAGLWLAVLGSGIYHGLNPGMGWPLAVSAGLLHQGRRALLAALASLAAGHFAAMAGILLPFALLTTLLTWQLEIRVFAGVIVVCAGLYLLVARRHPRILSRIGPRQLALWSLAVATAHGAGLMLLPVYLGLCQAVEAGNAQQAESALIGGNLLAAVSVAAVHAGAMVLAGGAVAFAVYEWLGLKFIARSWFNLDALWALSLVGVGGSSLIALAATH
jgi:hypothetical protein